MFVSSTMRTENGIEALTPYFSTETGAGSVAFADVTVVSSPEVVVEPSEDEKLSNTVSSMRLHLFTYSRLKVI